MPAEIKWYIPELVIQIKLHGDVTIEDVKNIYPIGVEMQESVKTTYVHTIVDLLEVNTFSRKIAEYRSVLGETASNTGWVVFIGENKLIRFFTSIAANFINVRMTYVSTMDEALTFLSLRDLNISPEKIKQAQD